ncbi:hypothetical protein BURK2_01623 [Burkholderiales bacterium]|nr:MAG: hypothetical protein F9K47_00275 [Burkholderiales bacterium]CAG0976967.1 hypothetical protein BURK2_01623 [Burkholderiales bacterium]
MEHPVLYLWTTLRAITEVVGYTFIGQGILAIFAGANRDRNFIYQLLKAVTNPIVKAVRFVTPRFVSDQHIPLAAFFVIFWLWVAFGVMKHQYCAQHNLACYPQQQAAPAAAP